jgi:hypothetical protein
MAIRPGQLWLSGQKRSGTDNLLERSSREGEPAVKGLPRSGGHSLWRHKLSSFMLLMLILH